MSFLEAHSVIVRKPGKTPEAPPIKTTSGRRGRGPNPDSRYPLGPCPV